MPANRFASLLPGANAPALGSYAIQPSNTADLPEVVRAITIGLPGVIRWRGEDGQDYATAELPAGTYAMRAVRVLATGTAAGQITDWA